MGRYRGTGFVDVIRKFGQTTNVAAGSFRNAAYAVIRSPGNLIAVISGSKGYFLPGGGAEPGESPMDTVLREVDEEMGCGLETIHRIGEAVQFFRADDGEYEMYAVFFTGELQGEVTPTGEELSWRSLQELEKDMYHECHLWAVRKVLGAEIKSDGRS